MCWQDSDRHSRYGIFAARSALVGQHVGLEVVDEGLLDVYFGVMKLGRLHERHMRIEDHMGRFRRCA